jgi:hypothetical protein
MNTEPGVWSFFQSGKCTGLVFSGTRANMLLNLPDGQVAVAGPFAPDDAMPADAEPISKESSHA